MEHRGMDQVNGAESDCIPEESVVGCILGIAAGDSLGLKSEGLTRQRQAKMFPDTGRQGLLFGKGMISDDTEHTLFTAEALIESGGNPDRFASAMGWKMRLWFLGLPAGIGFATLRSCLKLWLGVSPSKSGVFSAGNGSAMRAPIIGTVYGSSPEKMKKLIEVSTQLTHTDPKALHGSLAAALAAHHSAKTKAEPDFDEYMEELENLIGSDSAEFITLIKKALKSAKSGESVLDYCENNGMKKGVSGYIHHTMQAVLHCWFGNPGDFRTAVTNLIRCGGDTDTTAAILGGIIGAGVGKQGIPPEWLSNIFEFPRNISWMEKLAGNLAYFVSTGQTKPHPAFNPLLIPVRNCLFTTTVLAHGFRRMLPPY
ncbi:MAG: ADP-ribosylglycohydrolase family protein [Firmicutes bacterium]|nr:ADP-ribosylglycohydrolase family protein [Bacillota bacterium]